MTARIFHSLHDANDIFPVLSCFALFDNVPQRAPCARQVFVAIKVCEREGHVAEGDFYRLCFELCAAFKLVDELFLFFCQVAGQKDSGVEGAEQGAEFGRRRGEEDGEGA